MASTPSKLDSSLAIRPLDAETRSVSEKDEIDYPFRSAFLDHHLVDPQHINIIINRRISYAKESRVGYLEIFDGKVSDPRTLALGSEEIPQSTKKTQLRAFFIVKNESEHIPLGCRQDDFIRLLEFNCIPPVFVEALTDNNGAELSFLTEPDYAGMGVLHIIMRCPMSGFTQSAIYFRYEIESCLSTLLVIGTATDRIQDRLFELFKHDIHPSSSLLFQDNPFVLFSTIISVYAIQIETHRENLDRSILLHGSRLGNPINGSRIQNHDPKNTLGPKELSKHLAGIRMTQEYLIYMEVTIEGQINMMNFITEQHEAFLDEKLNVKAFRKGRPPITNPHRSEEEILSDTQLLAAKVRKSLNFSKTKARHRLRQVQSLMARIEMQLSNARDNVNQSDAQANIQLAVQSATIALAARRDSISMKAIAALTMLFLPGTFVATLFSMTFFHVDSKGDGPTTLNVESHWWLYVAVTVPLTIMVVGSWLGWVYYKKTLKTRWATEATKEFM